VAGASCAAIGAALDTMMSAAKARKIIKDFSIFIFTLTLLSMKCLFLTTGH
jgi:hypothetical protein